MNREEAIEIIEDLYPPDSKYASIAYIGQLTRANAESYMWRELPDEVLLRMAEIEKIYQRTSDPNSERTEKTFRKKSEEV